MKKQQTIVWDETTNSGETWTRREGKVLRNHADYIFLVEMDGKKFWLTNDRIVIQVIDIR